MAKKKAAPSPESSSEEAPKKSKKGLIIGVVACAGSLFAGSQFLGGSSSTGTTVVVSGAETTTIPDPMDQTAVPLDDVILLLADGKYMKVGITVFVSLHSEAGGHGAAPAVKIDDMKPKFDKLRGETLNYMEGMNTSQVRNNSVRRDLIDHLMEKSELWFEHVVVGIEVPTWTPVP
jgi:hypothetical protein